MIELNPLEILTVRTGKLVATPIMDTYRCIIIALENMPGMKMEDVFRGSSPDELRVERDYIEKLIEKNKKS
jgi:hypothetical protein